MKALYSLLISMHRYQFYPCVDTDCWLHTLDIMPPVPGHKQNLSWRQDNLKYRIKRITANAISKGNIAEKI